MRFFALAALAVTLSLFGCTGTKVTSARFVDTASGIQIDYILTNAHAILAEYERELHVDFGTRKEEFLLEMDPGGYVIQNIYRYPGQKLLLFDGSDYIVVDAKRETVEQVALPLAGMPEYLGCFDWPPNEVLRFIPAAERAEKRPIQRPEH